MRTLIIAEAGVNHNGSLDRAKQLIAQAASCGADLIKFQTFSAGKIVSLGTGKAAYQKAATDPHEGQHEMLRKLELSRRDHEILIGECRDQGIGFLSTAFDQESFDLLVELGVDLVKIPSGEINNLPYLRHVSRYAKPILLSTGMAGLGDIEAAIDVIESAGTDRSLITVLHCTTEYPAPFDEVNLHAMANLKSAFGVRVGYSDHTQGIEVSLAAVALGASVIEKHLTLDRALPGPDHRSSLEPSEFKNMVNAIRNIEVAMGDGIKRASHSEIANRAIARKSLVASRPIRVGECFSVDNIAVKRPGTGISPMRWDEIIGRRASRDFQTDELIEI